MEEDKWNLISNHKYLRGDFKKNILPQNILNLGPSNHTWVPEPIKELSLSGQSTEVY